MLSCPLLIECGGCLVGCLLVPCWLSVGVVLLDAELTFVG